MVLKLTYINPETHEVSESRDVAKGWLKAGYSVLALRAGRLFTWKFC